MAKEAQGRVGEQPYKSKGPSQKTGIVIAKRKFNLLFLRVRRKREMKSKKKMKMMVWWGENQFHKTATLSTEELFFYTQYI